MPKSNKESFVKDAIENFRQVMVKYRQYSFDNMYREHKGELFVLQFLCARDRDVLPSELSVALQCSMARISALLGSLEKKELIQRDIDKSNRRNILVSITDAGREKAATEMKAIEDFLARVFSEMGEADALEFIRLYDKFFDIIKFQVEKGE